MKQINILIVIALLAVTNLNAQNDSNGNYQSVEVNIGRSFSGLGDVWGFQYGFIYSDRITKKLNWFTGLEGSLHDDNGDVLIYDDPDGNTINSTLHEVTSGIQLIGGVRYNFIQNAQNNLGISLGAIFRYQATSINDVVYTFYPPATNFPVPFRVIVNESKQRTYSPGGAFKIHYNYKFNKKYFIGLTGGFQTDTNEDTISYITLNIGFLL